MDWRWTLGLLVIRVADLSVCLSILLHVRLYLSLFCWCGHPLVAWRPLHKCAVGLAIDRCPSLSSDFGDRSFSWVVGRPGLDYQSDISGLLLLWSVEWKVEVNCVIPGIRDVEHVKEVVQTCWEQIGQDVIDRAIGQFRKRLSLVVATGGGHIEHRFD